MKLALLIFGIIATFGAALVFFCLAIAADLADRHQQPTPEPDPQPDEP